MYFVFEKNIGEESFNIKIQEILKVQSIPFSIIEITPFSHEVYSLKPEVPENEKFVFYFGSIGGQKVAKEKGWIVFDKDFGVESYKKLGSLFLNNDGKIYDINNINIKELPEEFFIRPTTDDKDFAGQVVARDNFQEWLDRMLTTGYIANTENLNVLIAPTKIINREIRCVCYKSMLITASQYRDQYNRKHIRVTDEKLLKFLQLTIGSIAAYVEYMPDDIYVMDFAETNDGWKVIEYNCFNSAGLYDCDPEAVITMLRNYCFSKLIDENFLQKK